MCGSVRQTPKFAPEDISIKLFGPGVIDDTKANATSAVNNSTFIPENLLWLQNDDSILIHLLINYFAYFVCYDDGWQYMTVKDRLDERILRELKCNGRISNTELAHRVGLSPSACLRRVQDLERLGVIKGYKAVLNPAEIGISFVAYVAVGLSDHSKQAQENFERVVSSTSVVSECHNITGVAEYLLRVETKDLLSYKTFHSEVLGSIPQVNSIQTYVVMSSPKDERA